jgi:proteasome component ECM29
MAERELELVNKVELRIVLANTDEQLTGMLKVYLPPLLLKLNSPHQQVVEKVVEICQHINQRIRSGYV